MQKVKKRLKKSFKDFDNMMKAGRFDKVANQFLV
jgi:hypothetical protein|tara:strand:- start:11983 stop:12084 length:102 start_codon:yes stop_codon:yes gene_type:complete